MNYMEQVAEMLGVKLDEEFRVKDDSGNILHDKYHLSDNGLINEYGEFKNGYYLVTMLTGALTIVKRPFRPKIDEIYFYVGAAGAVRWRYWDEGTTDYLLFNSGNYFRTEEEITEETKERILDEMKSKYASGDW